MTVIHSPGAGAVHTLDVLADVPEAAEALARTDHGLAIIPVLEQVLAQPETALVAPIRGTLTVITRFGVEVEPEPSSPPVPTCRCVVVHLIGGNVTKRSMQAAVGDVVEAGQQLLRWKTDAEALPSYVVHVIEPEGEVLCDVLESEVYTAEPLLEIVGPLGEELSPVVAVQADGSVTPRDTNEASELTAAGVAPGQAEAARA